MPRKKRATTDQPIGVGLTAKQMKRKKPLNSDYLVDITPITDNFCPKNNHPNNATSRGMLEAIIAANEASIHCIATKFKPRYIVF